MHKQQRILFLYTELAGYTIACINRFRAAYPDVEVHLVRWPVNSEAPFKFSFDPSVKIYERKSYDRNGLLQLAEKISPDAILCSGWIDKDYVHVCRKWKKKIPVILVMDNKWLGTMKQRIAQIVSRFSILKSFSHAWVPGAAQKEYALKLGFPASHVRAGFYSADVDFFYTEYERTLDAKRKKFPHRFIYAGRYYDFKGVKELWEAFDRVKKEIPCDWELWCLGTGDVQPAAHPAIRHFGFVQPPEMPAIMEQAGVFILPSLVEPWGVVVHEFAAAGFPLLLSDKTGAAPEFLRDGENGFLFPAGDVNAMCSAMKKIIGMDDEQLLRMSERSAAIGMKVTPATWANTLFELMNAGKAA